MIRAGDNVNSHSSTAFLQARLPAQGKTIAPSGVFVELPDWGTCFFRQHFNPGKPTLLLVHGMVCSSGLNWFTGTETTCSSRVSDWRPCSGLFLEAMC